MLEATQSRAALVRLWIFVVAPFVALLAAVPVAWELSTLDAALLVAGYLIAIAGVTVGFHRHLTRGSFKAARPLRIVLAVARSFAIEGAPTKWVADHRRHHAFTDRDGGTAMVLPRWQRGCSMRAAAGCSTDLLADRGIRVVDRLFAPARAGGSPPAAPSAGPTLRPASRETPEHQAVRRRPGGVADLTHHRTNPEHDPITRGKERWRESSDAITRTGAHASERRSAGRHTATLQRRHSGE
jgi:hypothetical protein